MGTLLLEGSDGSIRLDGEGRLIACAGVGRRFGVVELQPSPLAFMRQLRRHINQQLFLLTRCQMHIRALSRVIRYSCANTAADSAKTSFAS